jgi:aryl-alcohol dehydrogenase-like predicted oxidoreductase
VNFVDTADVYHEGVSEQLLGEAMRSLGIRRSSLVLATKCRGRTGPGPNDAGLSRAHILDAIDQSLRRLGTDYVDLYQIHGYDPVTPMDEICEALDAVVRSGKVRYLGFCNLPAWRVAKALGIAERRGQHGFVSAQVFYTLASRDIERELVPLAREEGLAILPWSPLAGGYLTGKFAAGADATGPRRAAFDFPPLDRARADRCVEAMRPLAEARGVSIARIALGWLLHQRAVTSVIVGARTEDQRAPTSGRSSTRSARSRASTPAG